MAKKRKLRQEGVLLICTLLVIICGIILVVPPLFQPQQSEFQDSELYKKMVSDENIDDLLAQKGINIGESTKIRSLLRDKLPAGLFLSTFDITLDKLTVKYALTERSACTEEEYAAFWTEENCRQIVMYNSAALFALVRNLEIIEINVEGYQYPSCFITRDESTALFDNRALEEIITAEEWQQILITDGVDNEVRRDEFFAAHPLTPSTDA